MDKAELIRHEIEKRRDHNLAIGNPLFAAMAEEDIELLSFIDSLQKEPTKSVWHDARKEEPKPLERYVFVSDIIAPTISGTFTRPSQAIPWCEYVETYSIVKWAYVDDLFKL